MSLSSISESPNHHKFDPLDTVGLISGPALKNGNISNHFHETVTMSIDEVIQYAQPVADFTF